MHPILFHAGPVSIPSYGVATAFGILGALLLAMRTARQQGLNPNAVWSAGVTALFYGAIAAKIWMLMTHFRVLRSAPALLFNLAALGSGEQAAVAAVAACAVLALICRRQGIALPGMLDTLAAPVLLLTSANDFGALLAGCGYGRPAASGWSLTYHSAYAFVWWGTPLGVPLRPVQLYSGFVDVGLMVFALWAGTWGLRRGGVAALALLCAGFAHFLLQFWRGDVRPLAWLPLVTAAQLACLCAMAAATVLLWQPAGWRYQVPAERAA